ncbi:MAG: zinc ribbon domain-containing protein [bacterium]
MRERDPFDEFLLHCASDMEPLGRLPRTPESLQPLLCAECQETLQHNHRYCPNCGTAVQVPTSEENPYGLPRQERGRLFEVTVLGISPDVSNSGESHEVPDEEPEDSGRWTEVRLRLANRTGERLCVSLTFAQSALVDTTGRQSCPLPRDDGDADGLFDDWFYLYPHAWVEGTLLFPETGAPVVHLYVSCQPQDRDEELFHFTLR